MRTTTLAIVAALLIVGATGYWFTNRSLGAPDAEHWKRLKAYGLVIAMAETMPCPHTMVARRMKIEEAKEGFARLRARYTLTPDQAKELDHSVATGREVGVGGSTNLRECDGIGLRYFNDLIVKMAGGG